MKAVLLASEPIDYSIAFINGLARHADVTAIVPKDRYEGLRRWLDPALDLRFVDWPRHRSLSNPRFLYRLTRMIRAERPDLVHVLTNTVFWLNAAVPCWRGLPLVTTVHDVTPHPGDRETMRLPDWPASLMAWQSDHLVVHGGSLRAAAAARFGTPPERVHVLPHPAIRRYATLGREAGLAPAPATNRFRLLMFGRIYAYKGLQTLVRAEAALGARVPGLEIVIAGRGDDPLQLRPLMGNPGRYDIRHGFVEDIEVARLFHSADAVVLPYDEASQSGVLHLAATFGKPVIVTDVGELRATVDAVGMGLVVPPRAPDALADAIAALADSHDRCAKMGRRALAWSEGPNDPSTIGEAAAALYHRIVEAGRRAAPK